MSDTPLQLHSSTRRQLRRRVYYSFLVSLLLQPALVYGLLFGGSMQLFRELVFVEMVLTNFLAVEVGQVPLFFWQVLTAAGLIELAALGVVFGSVGLLLHALRRPAVVLSWRSNMQYS